MPFIQKGQHCQRKLMDGMEDVFSTYNWFKNLVCAFDTDTD